MDALNEGSTATWTAETVEGVQKIEEGTARTSASCIVIIIIIGEKFRIKEIPRNFIRPYCMQTG
jgi:hypothetical protein